MCPRQGSQEDHGKGKIPGKYYFQEKSEISGEETIIRGSAVKALTVVLGGVWRRLRAGCLRLPPHHLKTALDNCPDSQPLSVAPRADAVSHD
jgi:hypothetical protein